MMGFILKTIPLDRRLIILRANNLILQATGSPGNMRAFWRPTAGIWERFTEKSPKICPWIWTCGCFLTLKIGRLQSNFASWQVCLSRLGAQTLSYKLREHYHDCVCLSTDRVFARVQTPGKSTLWENCNNKDNFLNYLIMIDCILCDTAWAISLGQQYNVRGILWVILWIVTIFTPCEYQANHFHAAGVSRRQ